MDAPPLPPPAEASPAASGAVAAPRQPPLASARMVAGGRADTPLGARFDEGRSVRRRTQAHKFRVSGRGLPRGWVGLFGRWAQRMQEGARLGGRGSCKPPGMCPFDPLTAPVCSCTDCPLPLAGGRSRAGPRQ